MSSIFFRSRADIFALLGDFTMAIVNYTQAIKFNPTDENAFYQRAQLYEKKGEGTWIFLVRYRILFR